MSARALYASETASELRRTFDRTFSDVPRGGTIRSDDLLAVRLGADAYAIRLSEIAGLFSDKKITRLPSRVPALIGIAGFRGAILPVYDLSVLIGSTSAGTSQWLVMAANDPVAFAFDGFDGHLRLSRDAIAPHESRTEPSRSYVREVVRAPGHVRPILHMASVLETVKAQLPQDPVRKEQ